jgi:ABC-type enterochelin transport system ATPase subunit
MAKVLEQESLEDLTPLEELDLFLLAELLGKSRLVTHRVARLVDDQREVLALARELAAKAQLQGQALAQAQSLLAQQEQVLARLQLAQAV